ncbi:hypothetical protein AB0P17_15405 [Streptomyces sp. NPDC088124]|uniref:hypothetical protein n=1 Tax=Streptomyces sp. NPDC088124 TaxID=3154654 RepID=UPI0034424FAE
MSDQQREAARRHRAYELLFAAGCLALSAVALWCADHGLWWHTVLFGGVALVLADGAARSGADYRHARARAIGTTTGGPCCATWPASRHTVHGARCTHTNPPYESKEH